MNAPGASRPLSRQSWRCIVLSVALSALPIAACSEPEEDRLARELNELLAQARTLVRADGCATTRDCGVAAVGAKPCGGPSTYWVYCRTTTDEAELLATLEEARRVEALLNELTGLGSDCRFIEPPEYLAVDGVCQESQR